MNYAELSKNAKVHISDKTLPDKLMLATKALLLTRAFAYILIFPLLAALLMLVTLKGVQQEFYLYATLFLILLITFFLGAKQHLVLDNLTATTYLEQCLFGIKLRCSKEQALTKTVIVLARSVHKENTYQLTIQKQNYVIGKFKETEQALLFIVERFHLQAFEQVSQYPNEIAFHNHDISEVFSSETTKSPHTGGLSTHTIEPLWTSAAWLKLLLPLPIFIVLGFLLKQLGS
ncbi:hypothetical protein HWQ46_21320 [Shewanella sp. D64]|uniref:hypothetical protein n=1 Tax=unclassified Shewanella TaxID=196818 RepID=UPI0022BA31C2|nr:MULTISPECIES: hypothetical protein [unclassified Shewanella]MEC4728080.1 hypothetical protein [Shewanella sp. D64]MEC4738162.1 hypothetical protein [Shewanella sp. E94]WBJ96326.1 hypothetical protein HWQ47_04160 [Shewanella sp. MTB7]